MWGGKLPAERRLCIFAYTVAPLLPGISPGEGFPALDLSAHFRYQFRSGIHPLSGVLPFGRSGLVIVMVRINREISTLTAVKKLSWVIITGNRVLPST